MQVPTHPITKLSSEGAAGRCNSSAELGAAAKKHPGMHRMLCICARARTTQSMSTFMAQAP